MLLLGIDIGTSAIKISVVDADKQSCVASLRYPEEEETAILTPEAGWAEQSPDMWWEHVQQAIRSLNNQKCYNPQDIKAIGIAYQMHGLVMVDKALNNLRNVIIWCDSRAVSIGEKAFRALGEEAALASLLNSPGNFTAAKLGWIKEYEPVLYDSVYKVMLPGDYIAMKLTGTITTSISALSEGIFWDFRNKRLSKELMDYFGFREDLIPTVAPLFGEHGRLSKEIADKLGLAAGIPISYKAGDQPNNALSLNVLNPGEVAATAGTSGVIYGVSDQLVYDRLSRVNTFAHVNYGLDDPKVGVLLCINGTGILNRWVKEQFGKGLDYEDMNRLASTVSLGSDGLKILPFGNGAERILENRILGAHLANLDLNKHQREHVFRASQEGIAFAFRYGLDIMRENGMSPEVIRAGKANLFLSDLFTQIFVNVTDTPVELYNNDGSVGAALGAGIGAGVFNSSKEAFQNAKALRVIEPNPNWNYEEEYGQWLHLLENQMK
ncbi:MULTISPECIES: xylulokinase [Olivibacter]|uniref:Xylulokinase n=1 Tax=Olivibacter jilunii TaxID=985016 RepID=A0ABW6ATY6_9SPHI|nr:FGGY family carbohydrate kinase [Olivibacter sp. UJ_SKK_5.1]MDX3914304.1 FGGY family carbohydrate kinase [Pseudosphingobacterium sp.]